jgi:NADPH-dependent 2,4-dienoyl-CoA reductase/sulfur reductase-like enzyme
MRPHYPLVVIGGGPAGMAAASVAADHGVTVAVLDEQAHPGGQIYRNITASPLADVSLLGPDYQHGRSVVDRFRRAKLEHLPGAAVWYIDEERQLGVLKDGVNRFIGADAIIAAVGAQERPMPIPGWQTPGVMTAGAGQILLKSAGLVPEDGVVLAGSGPLLLLIAWQYLRAGVTIQALVDTTPRANTRTALPKLPRAIPAADYLWKGLSLLTTLRRARVPVYTQASDLHVEGENAVEAVRFVAKSSGAGTSEHRIETRILLLHQGVIPNTHLPFAAGCALDWNDAQLAWQPRTDDWGESAQPGFLIAGDASEILGARAAELHGRIVGLNAAHKLGHISREDRDALAKSWKRSLSRHLAIRPFLDALYRPADAYLRPSDDTLVCRCEEVTAGEIRRVARLGCRGPNQAKAFTRCGMGPCQGRQCRNVVSALIGEIHNIPMAEVGDYRARPPLKPITLGQLAGLEIRSGT